MQKEEVADTIRKPIYWPLDYKNPSVLKSLCLTITISSHCFSLRPSHYYIDSGSESDIYTPFNRP